MRRFALLVAVLPLSTIIGCSSNFMPMGDFVVAYDLIMPADIEFASIRAYVCTADESACGRRKINTELYDPDLLVYDYGGTEREMIFEPSGAGNEQIEAGSFPGTTAKVGEDDLRGFQVNDFPFISLDIPPRFQVSAPAQHATLERSASSSVRVEWTSFGKGFPMQWKLIPVDNEIESSPCEMLSWGSFKGEGEDLGFVDIPIDIFPSDLPSEGCEVAVRISRVKSFDLPTGIANGYIHSTVVDGVIFRMIP